MSVVLPAPFSPSRPWTRAGARERETSSRARVWAKRLRMWRSSMVGAMRQHCRERKRETKTAIQMAVYQSRAALFPGPRTSDAGDVAILLDEIEGFFERCFQQL